jgi:hypothetical protein
MRPAARLLNDLASNPWFVVGGTAASIIGLVLYVWEKISGYAHILSITIFVLGVSVYLLGLFYSIIVRQENDALRHMAAHLHRINHDYRNILHSTFSGNTPCTSRKDLVKMEIEALKSATKRIESIFVSLLGGRPCTVTVKLITNQSSGRRVAKTYVRSESNCNRDDGPPFEYDLGTNQNTAFDMALKLPEPNKCSHFIGGDLTKYTGYNNQRPQWANFYKSTIVVPIRFMDGNRFGQPDQSQDLGFLCVDTLSRNWLNEGYHVELMSAFADQMYNFLSLMRGRYTVLVENEK